MKTKQRPDPGVMARLRTSGDDIAWAAGLVAEWPLLAVDEIWSAHHQVAHLLAVETENYHVRIKRMLAEEQPVLASWDTEAFNAGYSPRRELGALAARFATQRAKTVAMLEALSDSQWRRTAVWPDGSVIDLAWLAEKALWHTLDHTQQMVDLHQEFTAKR